MSDMQKLINRTTGVSRMRSGGRAQNSRRIATAAEGFHAAAKEVKSCKLALQQRAGRYCMTR